MPEIRNAPADFAAIAHTFGSVRGIARHYGTGPRQAHRWLADCGVSLGTQTSDVPADLAQMAKAKGIEALQRHYGVGRSRMNRWLKVTGVTPILVTKPLAKLPADFTEVAPTLSKTKLAAHYQTSFKTVTRWLRETGVQTAIYVPTQPVGRGNVRPSRGNGRANLVTLRTKSMFDEAADTLRRERFVVHRCDERGVYAEKGDLWRVGWSIHTPDELLQRAHRYLKRAA